MPMDTKHCIGCRNDYYNGKNERGIEECWHLEQARLVSRKLVPLHQVPPFKQKPRRVPNCYSRPGYVCIEPDREY